MNVMPRTKRKAHDGRRHRVRGYSLFEVLIALFVLAVGLLGLGLMQTLAVGAGRGGYLRTQAAIAAHDIVERMRLNTQGIADGLYNDITPLGPSESAPAPCGPCSAEQIRDWDRYQWGMLVLNTLPNGSSRVTSSNSKDFTVIVEWDDVANAGDPGLSAAERQTLIRQQLVLNVSL
jgi:type IV pilus assembly protein PilV